MDIIAKMGQFSVISDVKNDKRWYKVSASHKDKETQKYVNEGFFIYPEHLITLAAVIGKAANSVMDIEVGRVSKATEKTGDEPF